MFSKEREATEDIDREDLEETLGIDWTCLRRLGHVLGGVCGLEVGCVLDYIGNVCFAVAGELLDCLEDYLIKWYLVFT